MKRTIALALALAACTHPRRTPPLDDALVVETDVAAAPPIVWRAWTENSLLTRWLTARANVKAEVGGPYELFWDLEHPELNSTLDCKVRAVSPPSRLAFDWRGPPEFADLMNTRPFPTSAEVTLSPGPHGGTHVRLVHSGFGAGERWAQAKRWQKRAWERAFANLPGALTTSSP